MPESAHVKLEVFGGGAVAGGGAVTGAAVLGAAVVGAAVVGAGRVKTLRQHTPLMQVKPSGQSVPRHTAMLRRLQSLENFSN